MRHSLRCVLPNDPRVISSEMLDCVTPFLDICSAALVHCPGCEIGRLTIRRPRRSLFIQVKRLAGPQSIKSSSSFIGPPRARDAIKIINEAKSVSYTSRPAGRSSKADDRYLTFILAIDRRIDCTRTTTAGRGQRHPEDIPSSPSIKASPSPPQTSRLRHVHHGL